jgi:hypothetical protein
MKKFLFIVIVFLTANLFAQQDSITFKTKFGIGVTFGQDITYGDYNELFIYPMTFGNIYLSFDLTPNFRIEPEIGFFRAKSKDESYESSSSNIRFGIGLFHIKSFRKSKIHIGGRVGIIHMSLSYESPYIGSNDSSKDDYFMGFATGGEYLFNEYISLGGEAQVNYIKLGNYDDDDNSSSSIISTRALAVLRVYF